MFELERGEMEAGWRRLHNEELNLSSNIITLIKSRIMRCSLYVACTGETRNAYKTLVGKYERNRQLRRPRCRWEIVLGFILEKYGGNLWTTFIWLRIGTSGGFL
jgi:hypothetical protein